MNRNQNLLGFAAAAAVLILGATMLPSSALFFRLLIGIGLGYALSRAFLGFAGSVNRACGKGSAKLMIMLMWMFLATAVISIAFFYGKDTNLPLKLGKINFGLILGGLLFGVGMNFCSCCATGSLTNLVPSFPWAVITLLFLCLGVFLGFPVQATASWVRESWFSTSTGLQLGSGGGVFLPDFFKWDGLDGYLGAILLTAFFAGIVVYISKKYEDRRKLSGTYNTIAAEEEQCKVYEEIKPFKLFSVEIYERIFVRRWTMKTGAIVIIGLFTLLMGVTNYGWTASGPFGIWFGKLLMLFGVSADKLSAFTHRPMKEFTISFFANPTSVQNVGIVLGTIIYFLLAGKFHTAVTSKIRFRDVILFATGGLMMGFGTRLSNGCNVGALYTPIATFSLSGWLYLLCIVVGGVYGSKITRKIG